MKAGISGHRPERISHPAEVKLAVSESLKNLNVSVFYQGMAAGVDLWSAKEAWKLGIPYVAVRPWAGHKPRVADELEYSKVMKHAAKVIDVSGFRDYTGPWLYMNRNRHIVDKVDTLIAVWDGEKTGGTYECIKYAWFKAVPVLRIDVTGKVVGYIAQDVPF